MRHIRKTTFLALLATLALAAVAAASASAALPEFEGPISETKPLQFKMKFGEITLQGGSPEKPIVCTEGAAAGTFTDVKHGTTIVTFYGCSLGKGTSYHCQTVGAANGVLVGTEKLPITLVWDIQVGGMVPGFVLNPAKLVNVVPKFWCYDLGEAGPITGAHLIGVGPENTKASSFEVTFKAKTSIYREGTMGENHEAFLEWTGIGNTKEALAVSGTGTLTTSRQTEIKTI